MPKDKQHRAPKRTRHYPPRSDVFFTPTAVNGMAVRVSTGGNKYSCGGNMDETRYELLCDAADDMALLLAPIGFNYVEEDIDQGANYPFMYVCHMQLTSQTARPHLTVSAVVTVELTPDPRTCDPTAILYTAHYPNRLARKSQSSFRYAFKTKSGIDMLRHIVAMMDRNDDIIL